MSKARGLADLGNVYNDGALSNRNILINGNLTVNQRNLSIASVATGAYGEDRWKKTAGGMTQIIEELNYLPSTEYTLSGTGITTQQITSPASGNWTLPDIPVTARLIQLELGDTATPFEHRSYSDQLQSCQRYYLEVRRGSYPEAYHYYARSTTAVVGNVPFPVTMRATPSVTLNSNGVDNRAVRVDTAALVTFSPAQSWWTKDAMAGLYTNVNTPFVSGESYGIGIKADAEL
tara:strand:- start:6 stop:704 length:699 start_codon:yes stop_codon:yes gene_type:complete